MTRTRAGAVALLAWGSGLSLGIWLRTPKVPQKVYTSIATKEVFSRVGPGFSPLEDNESVIGFSCMDELSHPQTIDYNKDKLGYWGKTGPPFTDYPLCFALVMKKETLP